MCYDSRMVFQVIAFEENQVQLRRQYLRSYIEIFIYL